MDSHDRGLLKALEEWRRQTHAKEGFGGDDIFGAQLFVVDDVLERIVELAHHFKLPDVNALAAQTGWYKARQYGPEILGIVRRFFSESAPAPQPTSARKIVPPPPGVFVFINNESPAPAKQSRQCKACGASGHIGITTKSTHFVVCDSILITFH